MKLRARGRHHIVKAISFGGRKSGRGGTLHVLGSDRAVRIEAGETLLSAAVRGDIPFPHRCNVGECGTCKCRLITGHIRLSSDISRHVAPEELSAGFVLACQSLAMSEDVAVEVPGMGAGAPRIQRR